MKWQKNTLSLQSASLWLMFVLPTVNTVHINRLRTAVRSRMKDVYIYKCFPRVSRQPRDVPQSPSFKIHPALPILSPFHPHHHCMQLTLSPDSLIIFYHYKPFSPKEKQPTRSLTLPCPQLTVTKLFSVIWWFVTTQPLASVTQN